MPNGWRRWLGVVLLGLVGVLLPIGLLAGWANVTFYDSDTFSQRAVDLLNSPAVRRALADKLTGQLAASGNQQAVNFRPAFQLAIEAAIDTDTFRSIFRTALRRTHQAIVTGQESGAGLDLSDSVTIITGTLRLPENAKPGQQDKRTLGSSLEGVTQQLADLRVWQWQDISGIVAGVGVGGAFAAASLAIAISRNRRRTVRRVGTVIVVAGIALTAVVLGAQWYAGRAIGDQQLAAAVQGALDHGMADLRSIGLWTAAYGVVMAAAASGGGRLTPARAASALNRWVERRRATTGGTVLLGIVAILSGVVLVQNPSLLFNAAVGVAGLWLAYFGVAELLRLVRSAAPITGPAAAAHPLRRRLLLGGGAIVALLALISAGLVITTRRAANRADAAGVQRCNGETSLCDLPLNLAVFPATHNSMSSALYPGWLFAEHVRTIGGQLDGGARALLIDTHYGVPSSARLPGSETPLILTDRAAELSEPTGEQIDPAIAQRAAELSARAPRRPDGRRDIYLCHNFCELGSVSFASALAEVKGFVDTHPDDVVLLDIQDATTPADTAAAITESGLADRAYTLRPNEPLPTLGEMIRAHRTLLVFAEAGGPGAPPWYHRAYEWFQETPYTFDEAKDLSCAPNRGRTDAPLFLLNHWLVAAPPDPARAAAVNTKEVLENRIRQCTVERGQIPNVVAVNFSERGDLYSTVRRMNRELLGQVHGVRRAGRAPPPASAPAPGAPTPSPPPATSPPADSSVSLLPVPTRVTSLTGGDPARLCAGAPALQRALGAWALAKAVAPPAGRALPDLTYGPAAARSLDAVFSALPAELARLATPARDRARAAVQALSGLGLDARSVEELAAVTEAELTGPSDPDPVVVQRVLTDRLRAAVGDDRLTAAAQAFAASHPEPAGLFDLGDVPNAVATDAGYACLVPPGG